MIDIKPYSIRKNDLSDYTYIVFGRYKSIIMSDGELWISIDKSAFGEFRNLQLLKVIETDLKEKDYDEMYSRSIKWITRGIC